MTSPGSLSSVGRGQLVDGSGVEDWIARQQRQFAEFDSSFGVGRAGGLGDPFFSHPLGGVGVTDPVFRRTERPVVNYQPEKMGDSSDLSPKAKVSYDQDKFQVEFNVQEYSPEDLSIKTEGDVLIVLAKHETKVEGGQSFVSKQFEQRFSLPSGVKPDKISSSLSKDGYLTVTAPRESMAITGSKRNQLENNTGGQVYTQSPETRQESDGLPHPKVSYDDDKFEIALDAKEYSPEDMDVKVEGNTIILTAKQEIQEAGGTRTRVFEQKFSLPSGVNPEKVKSSLSRDGVLTITAPRGNVAAQSSTSTLENKMDKVMSPSSWNTADRTSKDTKSSLYDDRRQEPVFDDQRRGSAFDDRRRESAFDDRRRESAFDDLRKDSGFNSAIARPSGSLFGQSRADNFFDDKSIFDRERSGSLFDRDDRSLFAANSEQNGVSKVQYDNDTYKILVNVENFKPEDLVIKTVDNTVQVEAKHEEKTSDGRSYSTRSFNQSFTLPRGVNPELVSSALSKDGILTLSAPLPQAIKNSNSERLVPIKF